MDGPFDQYWIKRVHVVPGQALAPGEELELDDEQRAHDDASEALDELDLRAGGTPGREDVVEHDHARARGTASVWIWRLSVPYSSS